MNENAGLSDERLLAVVEALVGCEYKPITLTAIHEKTGIAIGTVKAKLKTLLKSGWVERDGERYHLGEKLNAIAYEHQRAAVKAARHLDQKFNRMTGQGVSDAEKERI